VGVTATAVGRGRGSGIATQLAVGATVDVTAAGRCAAVTVACPGCGTPSHRAGAVRAGLVAGFESFAAAATGS